MTTSASIGPEEWAASSEEAKQLRIEAASMSRPAPLSSLTAAAARITSANIRNSRGKAVKAADWQEDAWTMYDLVGEERFLGATLSGRMGQARFYVGKVPTNATEGVVPATEARVLEVFEALRGSGLRFAQMVVRLGINLFVAGDCYIVGTPKAGPATVEVLAERQAAQERVLVPANLATAAEPPDPSKAVFADLSELDWRTCSVSEVSTDDSGRVVLKSGEDDKKQGGSTTYDADEVILIRVWRPHPNKWWTADAPTKASLPVLRELVGLTMHISAQVDSRLAGAGILLVPNSVIEAMQAVLGPDQSDVDPFTDALIKAMVTPIGDRSSASAVVPLVIRAPDESIDKFRHISFSTPLDGIASTLREEAIRRLALGQDCPPELLLGVGGMNHWGAWLVREDVVTTHLEPPLALVCDAITTQYLWPALIEGGMDEATAHDYVVWYDVSHLIMRPNRMEDAQNLFDRGALSAPALRDAAGFDETSAPPAMKSNPPEVDMALKLLSNAPTLANAPGLPALVRQIKAILDGNYADDPSTVAVREAQAAPPPGQPAQDQQQPADGPPSGNGTGQTPAVDQQAAAVLEALEFAAGPDSTSVLHLPGLVHGGH